MNIYNEVIPHKHEGLALVATCYSLLFVESKPGVLFPKFLQRIHENGYAVVCIFGRCTGEDHESTTSWTWYYYEHLISNALTKGFSNNFPFTVYILKFLYVNLTKILSQIC